MDALKNTWDTACAGLRTMSVNTRITIGAFAVILVMALFLVWTYAGSSSMTVLPITLNNETRARTTDFLSARGIEYVQEHGRILVPTHSRESVVSALSENEIINPAQIDFNSMLDAQSVFETKEMFRARVRTAMQNVVGNMITAMSQVEWAEVVYSRNDSPGGIGQAWIPTVATVTVKPAGESVAQQTVDAIARLVAGTDGRLKVEDVAVIDASSGRAHRVRSDEAMSATIHLDYQRQVEALVKDKLESTLGYIPGIRVSVNAIVDVRTQQESVRRYDEPKVGPLSERTASYESSGGRGIQEPGVRANVPRSVSIAATGGASATQRASDISTASRFPESVSEITDPGGRAVQINAAIGIPRGWFLDVYADEVGDGTFDQVVFNEMVTNQISSIEGLVQPLVNTSATAGGQEGQVEVRMINDVVASVWGPSEPAAGSFASGLVQGETLQSLGVGLLAMVSLAMMFLMLKRAGSPTVVPHPEDFTSFEAIDDGAPDAPDSPAVLPGIEIDTAAAERQAMVTQVQSAIDQDPQEAASLIRRWIRQGA